VYSRYNNGPRAALGYVCIDWRVMSPQFQPLSGSACYANRILGQGSKSEGKTVLTPIGDQYAIL
jgi:hypothetical protein